MNPALAPSRAERAARGAVLAYLVLLVLVPMATLLEFGFADGLSSLVERVRAPVARSAIALTLSSSLLVALLNTLLGTMTAWVLVRYRLPGRAFVSTLIDLPLAIPTLVAGVMLAILYGPGSLLGAAGLEVAFAQPGIALALAFVTLPFVVRSVEPVLEEIDPAEEEAAMVLGAGPLRTFRTVFLPAILPAAISGGIRSFGRAMGEFGSIVVIAGNIPHQTLTAPVYVFGEIESGNSPAAAAVSIVLLTTALAFHGLSSHLERRIGARRVER